MLVIRFRNAKGIDFPYLLSMLYDSFISRPNTIVCPGEKMELALGLPFGGAVAWPCAQSILETWVADRPSVVTVTAPFSSVR